MKKNSKRLYSAFFMFLLSLTMLISATYAWFTMSREVEINGIQMTATMPEDIQISLGEITNASETNCLAKNGGYLSGEAPSSIYDWSNTADIGHYYSFGKLMPASSTNGETIYYTPDTTGVGRTLKPNAAFYAATATEAATSHLNDGSEWTPTSSIAWDETNDDGYYIDIPVWIRTSAQEDIDLYVCGYVTDKTEENNEDDDDIYQAVRVAILTSEEAENGGCLTLADGGDEAIEANTEAHTVAFPTSIDDGILDSDNYNNRTTGASGINAVSADTPAWSEITKNDGSTVVATLEAGDGKNYGEATKLIVRIWLEGEDGNCWNANVGQDWQIALKFMAEPLE